MKLLFGTLKIKISSNIWVSTESFSEQSVNAQWRSFLKLFIVKVIHLSAKLFDYNFMVRTLLKSKLVCMNLYVYGIYNRSKNPKYLELFYVVATSSQLFIWAKVTLMECSTNFWNMLEKWSALLRLMSHY